MWFGNWLCAAGERKCESAMLEGVTRGLGTFSLPVLSSQVAGLLTHCGCIDNDQ